MTILNKKLDWRTLETDNCPKCYEDLEHNNEVYRCTDCDFVMSIGRYKEIIEDMKREKEYE